jgi:hypothetical protein
LIPGKLKSAKSEETDEKLSQSVPEIPMEPQVTATAKEDEDRLGDIIARMRQTLAATGEGALGAQGKFFDWMSCHPGYSFHPVSHSKVSWL